MGKQQGQMMTNNGSMGNTASFGSENLIRPAENYLPITNKCLNF